MINRDSMVLWLGAIGALVVYLQNTTHPMAWDWNQWLQFVAFVSAFIAGKLGTSPLKGENDDKRIVKRRPRGGGLLFILAVSLGAMNCLPKNPPAVIDPTQTEQQVQAVREQAAVLVKSMTKAFEIAVESRRVAQRAYESGLIPASTMQRINDAAIVASNKGIAFAEFAKAINDEPTLKVTARELLRVFDGLIEALIEGKQGGDTIRAALAAFQSYLGGA